MSVENYWNILLLGIIPVISFFLFRFLKWRKDKQRLFAEVRFHSVLFAKRSFFSKLFPWLYLLAVLFLVLALVNFIGQEQKEVGVKSRYSNIIFLVDVSNSMNAEDVLPSRMEQAKKILTQSVEYLSDERVGIVVFAGNAQSIMPLTTDYSSADIYLRSIGSELVQAQGTDFLEAVKEAGKKLKNAAYGAKKIILISDGEDNEGNHDEAIKEAKKSGTSVTTVGIGTEDGAPIPEFLFHYYKDYKRDEEGQVVITKRESLALKSIAKETGGKYIDGNNPEEATRKIVEDIKSLDKVDADNTINTLNKAYYYQWFLGAAIFLFFAIYFFNPKQNLDF